MLWNFEDPVVPLSLINPPTGHLYCFLMIIANHQYSLCESDDTEMWNDPFVLSLLKLYNSSLLYNPIFKYRNEEKVIAPESFLLSDR